MVPAFLRSKHVWGLLLPGILLTGCSHKMSPEGHYQGSPIEADGKTNDWSLPLRFGNESHTLQYNVTNDDKNLYICVLSADEITQLRILKYGMTIYLDPKGDKHKDISVHFPIPKPPDPAGFRSRNDKADNNEGAKARIESLLLQSDYYGTIGLQGIENGQFAVADAKSPVKLAMKLNDPGSQLVFEAAIPLKNVPGADLTTHRAKKNFSVGIVLNAAQGEGRAGYSEDGAQPSRGGGMRGGGMGGMRGGMGGRMGGGGGMSRARQGGAGGGGQGIKEDASWYSFRLAVK